MKASFTTAIILLSMSTGPIASAQVIADFESFAPGTEVMFQEPRFSGSTANKLDPAPNLSTVTDVFPAGNANAGSRVYAVSYSISNNAAAPLWARLTTGGTGNVPNPTVDFAQPVRFEIFSDRDIYVTLGLRETSTSAAIGANGGGTGPIEWVGGTTDATPSPPLGRLVASNTWVVLTFDIPNEPVKSFTGNGILESTTGRGVLEHLALIPVASGANAAGIYNIYLDNFQVVPEPATYALLAVGCLAFGVRALRRNN
jgi:hypothetical protein